MKHPGQIAFYKIQDGEEILLHTEPIEKIPITMQFIDTPDGKIPVVKTVLMEKGKMAEIIEYGPKGEFLRSTILTNENRK
jgi:hypothetical protein